MGRSRSWPERDRGEYEAACARAWLAGQTMRERGDALLEEVHAALAAQKMWARDLIHRFGEIGAQREIKAWVNGRERIYVAHDGIVLNRPRVIGVQRTTDEGAGYIVQALFDVVTFAEIKKKVREWEGQIGAYRDNITAAKRVLELEEAAPGSLTPAEAVKALGITLDVWLGQEKAS